MKTLAFLDGVITKRFLVALKWFASNRQNATSTWLHRVVVVVPVEKRVPNMASVEGLRKHVPVVEVIQGTKLPTNLS